MNNALSSMPERGVLKQTFTSSVSTCTVLSPQLPFLPQTSPGRLCAGRGSRSGSTAGRGAGRELARRELNLRVIQTENEESNYGEC